MIPGGMPENGARLPFYEWNSSGGAVIKTVPVTNDSLGPTAGKSEVFFQVKTGTAAPAFRPMDGGWHVRTPNRVTTKCTFERTRTAL
jgi:hypothetical protein